MRREGQGFSKDFRREGQEFSKRFQRVKCFVRTGTVR